MGIRASVAVFGEIRDADYQTFRSPLICPLKRLNLRLMKSLPRFLAAVWLLVCAPFLSGQTPNPSPTAKPLRAFHIGNSLTFGVVSDPNHRAFMSGHGVDYKAG